MVFLRAGFLMVITVDHTCVMPVPVKKVVFIERPCNHLRAHMVDRDGMLSHKRKWLRKKPYGRISMHYFTESC